MAPLIFVDNGEFCAREGAGVLRARGRKSGSDQMAATTDREEALRELSAHFRMQINDIRRGAKNVQIKSGGVWVDIRRGTKNVQIKSGGAWIDIGTPGQVRRQSCAIYNRLYKEKGLMLLKASPEKWFRIATLIARYWRIEDDESGKRAELAQLIKHSFKSPAPSSMRDVMRLREKREPHVWRGIEHIFAEPFKNLGLRNLYSTLRSMGYAPFTVKVGSTTTKTWQRTCQ